jgi:RimJ/RimL family protein N-acetyltransferase
MSTNDAAFMLELLNDPSWLRFIGDRGVRTLDDASAYILSGPMAMYERLGYGFYIIELKEDGTPLGICGLVKRDFLDDVDIGYALLPAYWSKGYAHEAASAVMTYAAGELGFKRLLAITSPNNHSSIKLLEKLGLRYERTMEYPGTGDEIRLYAIEIEPEPAEG